MPTIRKVSPDEVASWPVSLSPRRLISDLVDALQLADDQVTLLRLELAKTRGALLQEVQRRRYLVEETPADWRCVQCGASAFTRSPRDPDRCIRCVGQGT